MKKNMKWDHKWKNQEFFHADQSSDFMQITQQLDITDDDLHLVFDLLTFLSDYCAPAPPTWIKQMSDDVDDVDRDVNNDHNGDNENNVATTTMTTTKTTPNKTVQKQP